MSNSRKYPYHTMVPYHGTIPWTAFFILTSPCLQKFQNGFYHNALKIPLTLRPMASTDNTLLDLHKEVNLYHVTKFSPYFPFTLYYFYKKISSFLLVLTTGTVGDWLLIFYSEKFSTWVWRLLFAVKVNLNLSINSPLPFPFSIFSTSPSDSTDTTYINFILQQTGTEH